MAWAAVAKEVNRTDPLSQSEVTTGEVPEAEVLAEGIAIGDVKLTKRTL